MAIEIPSKLKTDIGVAVYTKSTGRYRLYIGKRTMPLHKAVYLECFGKIPKGYVIHHIDGNRFNNKANNLIAIPRRFHKKLHKGKVSHYDVKVVRKIQREVLLDFTKNPSKDKIFREMIMDEIRTTRNILNALEDEGSFDEEEENLEWLEKMVIV